MEGTDRGEARVFLGVPYAAPPLGQQRWMRRNIGAFGGPYQHLHRPEMVGTPDDRATQAAMLRLWTHFAAEGRPPPDVGWARFGTTRELSLRIGPQPAPESFSKREDCDFWDGLYGG